MRAAAMIVFTACHAPITDFVSPPGHDEDVARIKKYVVDPVNASFGCEVLTTRTDAADANIEWRTFDQLLDAGFLGEFNFTANGWKLFIPSYLQQKVLSAHPSGDCVLDEASQAYDCSEPNANWVYLHEAGHAMTLAHVNAWTAIMYGGHGWNGINKFVGADALADYVAQLKEAGIACPSK
jgi:hypothetical protein